MHTWNRSERWAFVTMPLGRQRTASASNRVRRRCLKAFARGGGSMAAYQAWEAALRRWPDNLPLAIGLGNTAYRSGDLEGARRAFETARGAILRTAQCSTPRLRPRDGQGRTVAARKLAQRALGLGKGAGRNTRKPQA